MDVREKLVELLSHFDEHCVTELCCEKCGAKDEEDCEAHARADFLIANGVTVQEWISVKDRLPEHKGNYLGFTGSTTMVGYYKGSGIWWIWLNDTEGKNLFTHWMPLPPVPEEE